MGTKETKTPYIGIVDFSSFEQVQNMLRVFNSHLPEGSNRKLHIGLMMSYKTLNELPTKWLNVFPPKEAIANIFASDETYNCLHYADYDNDTELWKSLARAIAYGGTGIHALQLDMVWPDPAQVANGVHASRKQIEVILQVGKNALAEVNDDPQAVVERLKEYDGVIHRVLLDKSMGHGIGMDAQVLLPFARAINKSLPSIGLGAAGGLGPKTVSRILPLMEEMPYISFDAQAQLRPSGNALDSIDWDYAEEYLIQALKIV